MVMFYITVACVSLSCMIKETIEQLYLIPENVKLYQLLRILIPLLTGTLLLGKIATLIKEISQLLG